MRAPDKATRAEAPKPGARFARSGKQIEDIELFGLAAAPTAAQVADVHFGNAAGGDRAARDQRAIVLIARPSVDPIAVVIANRVELAALAIGVEYERGLGQRKQQLGSG